MKDIVGWMRVKAVVEPCESCHRWVISATLLVTDTHLASERQGRDAAWHRHHHHLAISVFPHQAFCPVDQGQGGTYLTIMGDGRVWQSSLWLHQLGSLWWASLIKQWHMGHTATAWQWQPPRPSWLYFAAATLRCMQPCIPMQRSILVLLNFHLSRWNCQLLTDFY